MTDDEIRLMEPRFMKASGEFKAEIARRLLRGKARYDPTHISRYPFKPFDVRLAYLDAVIQPLFSRPSPELLAQRLVPDNSFIVVRETSDKDSNSPPLYFSNMVCDYHCLVVEAKHIPIRLNPTLLTEGNISANLSPMARSYLTQLGVVNLDSNVNAAGLIWMHSLAIGYSPAYLSENADGIRQDWPRVPLPAIKEALEVSDGLGRQVAGLLDTEHPVPGVTAGNIRPELQIVAPISREEGGELEGNELAVTAGWGHSGQNNVVMPGKGETGPA